jgi:hypothetical protein
MSQRGIQGRGRCVGLCAFVEAVLTARPYIIKEKDIGETWK